MFILALRRTTASFWNFLKSIWNPPEATLTPQDGVIPAPIPTRSKAEQRLLDELARKY